MVGSSLFGKTLSGRFTIPSGIVTVTLDTLQLLANQVPELGILTTKSIGPQERSGNREPVYCGLEGKSTEAYANAVGLANPGCDAFAKELETLTLPPDRFLLISIFGGTTAEFVQVATAVERFADGLELNFSCPHAEGHGQAICSTPGLAEEVVKAVRSVTNKPILPKLSPNLEDDRLAALVGDLADAGAAGFTAINTLGPVDNVCATAGVNVLSKGKGGMSGEIVVDRALQVVRVVRESLTARGHPSLPILGMGGITTRHHCQQFLTAGATHLGVGSALTGLSTKEVAEYFRGLDAPTDPDVPIRPTLPDGYMAFRPFTLRNTVLSNPELGVFYFNEDFQCDPGQFVEVWIPEYGEKPYAPSTLSPLSLAIRVVGVQTKRFFELQQGDTVYIRGPYGKGFTVPTIIAENEVFVLVGGGTGIAPLLLLAERLSKQCHVPADRIHVYLGGRGREHIYFVDEFKQYATVHLSTDDGSEGFHGFVTQLLEKDLKEGGALDEESKAPPHRFYTCGPELMMAAAVRVQRKCPPAIIAGLECSVERYMKCGVGICGVCSCDGYRVCVDGPVLSSEQLEKSVHFGRYHRSKTTQLLEW